MIYDSIMDSRALDDALDAYLTTDPMDQFTSIMMEEDMALMEGNGGWLDVIEMY
jgi:hypothetical protein